MIDCVLIAGGVPQPEDPLYPFAQGKPKSLIEIAGKPMVQWVVDALSGTPAIRHIVVVGLSPNIDLTSPDIIHYHEDQGSLLDNGLAGIQWLLAREASAQQVLICCADIPLLRSEMVTWLIQQNQSASVDLTYTVIPRPTMEAAFPTSERTYARFEDAEVAGGDVHVVNPHIFRTHRGLWRSLTASRKETLKAALRLGPWTFVLFFLHRLSLNALEARVRRKFDLRVRVLASPYPEMGMDVDKPHQFEICSHALKDRTLQPRTPEYA